MSPFVLAAYCLLAPAGFLPLVALATFVGKRLEASDFSWWRYGAYLFGTLVGAVLVVAATSDMVFLGVAVALVAWVLLRAAADAQATTVREKIGFVQLYAGLSLVEYLALSRGSAIDGTRASPTLAYALSETLGHLVLPPLAWVFGSPNLPPWGAPGAVVGAVAGALAEHWLSASALGTFTVSALAYAHFAEHSTPKIGLSLLPFPTAASLLFAVLSAVGSASSLPAGRAAALATVFLAPFFVAEGLWVVHRLSARLRTRTGWVLLLAVLSLVMPRAAQMVAGVGWLFHLVRLRAFEPVLGSVERSAWRPPFRLALVASVGSAAWCAGLGAVEIETVERLSPMALAAPSVCGDVTLMETASGVVISSRTTRFSMDAEEMRVQASSVDGLSAACAARGARLCTSDEWALACLCTYPNDAQGGPKLFTNEKLVYRRDSERKEAGGGPALHGLLSGVSEVVLPRLPGGGVMLAGPTDAVDDSWTADCRTRAVLPESTLTANVWTFVGARCCR